MMVKIHQVLGVLKNLKEVRVRESFSGGISYEGRQINLLNYSSYIVRK